MLGAAALLFIGAFWRLAPDFGKPARAGHSPAIAVLAAANAAVWSDPNTELTLRSGELPPSLLHLESGMVEFTCIDGATVAVRGPATFGFLERRKIFVRNGRIQCRCPSVASRLTVSTPATEVEDLGTEFSVEVREDHSTRVAVRSGEVQIGKKQPHHLRKGEAVELRSDGVLAIQPFSKDDFAELLATSNSLGNGLELRPNLLRDPGFEAGLKSPVWSGTEANLETDSSGRGGRGMRVSARGKAHWPQCHQTVEGTALAGKLIVASVWAAPKAEDPLRGRQTAMLKIAFKDREGRDFAFACRRFLGPDSEPGRFEPVQVAAIVPPGTARMQFQIMLQSDLQDAGSVIFDDGSLVITEPPQSE
jgi:hypothetical protein